MKLTTRKDYFVKLDEILTEQDKKYIVDLDDVDELHFSLGVWIRNN